MSPWSHNQLISSWRLIYGRTNSQTFREHAAAESDGSVAKIQAYLVCMYSNHYASDTYSFSFPLSPASESATNKAAHKLPTSSPPLSAAVESLVFEVVFCPGLLLLLLLLLLRKYSEQSNRGPDTPPPIPPGCLRCRASAAQV